MYRIFEFAFLKLKKTSNDKEFREKIDSKRSILYNKDKTECIFNTFKQQ